MNGNSYVSFFLCNCVKLGLRDLELQLLEKSMFVLCPYSPTVNDSECSHKQQYVMKFCSILSNSVYEKEKAKLL